AVRFDREDVVAKAEAAVNGGDEPFAVGGPVERVEVQQLVVDVLLGLLGLEVVDIQPLGGGIGVGEFRELPLHVRDLRPIRAPARLPAIGRNLNAAGAVGVHVINI